jgi:hypothetical protein
MNTPTTSNARRNVMTSQIAPVRARNETHARPAPLSVGQNLREITGNLFTAGWILLAVFAGFGALGAATALLAWWLS